MIATATPTIPAAIADLPRGVVWRYDAIGGGKTTKVPYQAKQPSARASVADPATWASLCDALRAIEAGGFEGAGIMLGDLDDGRRLAGVDLDDCLIDGVLTDQAAAIVDALPSYWEVSPSGQGLKALCFGRKPEGSKCCVGQVEVYDDGRWFAITGQRFAGDAVVAAQAAIARVCGMAGLLRPEPVPVHTPPAPIQHADMTNARASAYLAAMPAAVEGSGGHNALYAAAVALAHGFALSKADALAMLWGEFNPRCSPPWDSSYSAQRREFERKVDQAMTQNHVRPRGWLLNEPSRAELPAVDVEALVSSASKPQHKPKGRRLMMTQGNEIDDERTAYLWQRRFAVGAMNIIFSRPGAGKSTLAADLASRVTKGMAWPDKSPC